MLGAKLRAVAPRVEAEHAHRTSVERAVALEHLDRGGLARAVGAEQREDLTGLDREAQSVDHGAAVVALGQLEDVDRGGHSVTMSAWRVGCHH